MIYTENIEERSVASGNDLRQQIGEIADALYREKKEPGFSGLLSGDAGICLFFGYLTTLYPDKKYEDITYEYLEKLGLALAGEDLSCELSSGIAGIGFVFQHLRNIGLLDPLEDLDLQILDEAVSLGAESDFKGRKWDPLHGLTGLGVYFIERYQETGEKKYLEKIVDRLVALHTLEKGCPVWVTPAYRHYSKDNYNFGMAHGMPGVLSFLAQVYALGIRRPVLAAIIPSCISFLLAHRLEKDPWYAFPGSIEITSLSQGTSKPPFCRNGWCYGDLGIAQALIHCGRSLDRADWTRMGIELALQTTRIPFEHSHCADASFCHGSVGLVHQYHRLYQATRDDRFKEAVRQWLAITQAHYYRPGMYAGGYAYRHYDEAKGASAFISCYGLLEGIAGIGLVFLSCQHAIETGWDIVFQTNIQASPL